MRIAVIGAGAMGSIYGGHLAQHNEVYLVDTNADVVRNINENGIVLEENGEDHTYCPKAVTDTSGLPEMDLVILFVKALFSRAALNGNRCLIGKDTYLLTLQNGSGHEDILGEFVSKDHIIIGTTEDQGTILGMGHIRHGGTGGTNLGMLVPDAAGILPKIKETMDQCGFRAKIHENIQQLIWNKLFVNVALSAVTAVLNVKMGFIADDPNALALSKQLLHEAVTVAHAMGLEADEAHLFEEIKATSKRVPDGITSICADLSKGRKTEVDTISGSVVRAARKVGVEVPAHEFLVNMVHAMENRPAQA
ncbi:MAG: ketopantoate reductase family protein [Clostridia bacterium]|nr:ketopantoate reductase family protein [Clostridia bacterium]